MILYKTIMEEACAEQTIEKSRFIAYAKPVQSKDEAEAFISSIKSKHKDATHNVPAMVIGDKFQIQWGSDDGEPQGTSGAPIVQMLVKEEITNIVIVVTRYFGGIKLGTGGLVRAYTGSAKMALEAAKQCAVKEMAVAEIKMDYSCLAKLQNMAPQMGYIIKNILYEDMITVTIGCEPEQLDTVHAAMANLTGGRAQYISEKTEFAKTLL